MVRKVVWLGIFLLFAGNAIAGGIQLSYYGIRQMSMGESGTGLNSDGSSMIQNPGAFIFSNVRYVQIGTGMVFPYTSYRAEWPAAYRTSTETTLFTPIFLLAGWQPHKKGKWAIGIAVNNPFGHQIQWPNHWKGRFIVQESAIHSFHIQPTFSYRFNEKWGFGFGPVAALSNILLKKDLPINGQNDFEADEEINGLGFGFGFNTGIYFRPSVNVSLGLNYRSAIRVQINNGEAISNVPASVSGLYPDSRFKGEYILPAILSFGSSFRAGEIATFNLDATYTFWTNFDSLIIDYEDNTDAFGDELLNRNYRNTFTFRAGMEYLLSERLKLRGGAFYDFSPVRDGHVSPELPDANRIGLTGGLGIQILDKLQVGFSMAYEFSGDRTSSFDASSFSGTYKSNTITLGTAIEYTF